MRLPSILNQECITYPDNILDLLFIGRSIFPEEIVGVGLSWRVRVWIIKKVLDPKENLLNSDSRLPTFFFI